MLFNILFESVIVVLGRVLRSEDSDKRVIYLCIFVYLSVWRSTVNKDFLRMEITCKEAEVASECGPMHPLGCGLDQGQGQGLSICMSIYLTGFSIKKDIKVMVSQLSVTRILYRYRS